MSDTKAQPEPTMEEILASIRRIISEGDEEGRAKSAASTATVSTDVLELTDMVAEDGSVVSLTQPDEEAPMDDAPEMDEGDDIPPVPEDGEADTDMLAGESEVTMDDAQDDKIEFSSEELIGQPRQTDGGLMSDAAAAAATAAFATLARSSSGNGGLSLGSGRTLEDLVQEMIRPMIKEWLDKNLPPMAERLVRKELERLSRRAEE